MRALPVFLSHAVGCDVSTARPRTRSDLAPTTLACAHNLNYLKRFAPEVCSPTRHDPVKPALNFCKCRREGWQPSYTPHEGVLTDAAVV
eukprot:CAMPEP_0115526476 /NCGR_PEP_ID=MMETSP0271-20121206/82318_1 /TAXON_ID=71861 /ORGANISM="Scrippsiella trochoidea, Strain CCMP3099" /LENGTH=88 /DNA_ID=CAMNT_0002958213 /DNA_START=1 /DNA_END=265 /DNA_ORIENTATION=+